MPVFTAGEALALVTLQFGTSDFNSGVTKLTDVLKAAAWPVFCQCNAGTAVPPPTGPTAPTGTPVLILPSNPGISACAQTVYSTTSPDANGSSFNRGGPILTGLAYSTATATVTNTATTGTGCTVRHDFKDQNGATVLATHSITVAPGETKSASWTIASGATQILDISNGIAGTGNSAMTGSHIDVFCGGQGSPVNLNQCQPDPNTQALLQAILSAVTLIQRQHVPFAYIAGTSHGPLHGSGEFNLTDIVLGLKVDVTGIDSSVGIALGDPDRLFEVGWVAVGDADGFWCQRRITNEHELFFPTSAGAATKVGWSTNSGASLTITELKREP